MRCEGRGLARDTSGEDLKLKLLVRGGSELGREAFGEFEETLDFGVRDLSIKLVVDLEGISAERSWNICES